ncbi:MAG: extracellular solute-binding protein [Armatimonadota bacterium]
MRTALPAVLVAITLLVCAVLWPRLDTGNPLDKQGKEKQGQIRLSQKFYFNPAGLDVSGQAFNAVLHEFGKERPDVTVTPWTMFRLPGALWNAQDMLAFAAKNAADIQAPVFHQVVYFRQQGLLLPLNQWIGEDTDGNGRLDDSEVKWKPFLRYNPAQRRIAMDGPTVYALPTKIFANGVIYRKDLLAEAGLDPRYGPRTWDELWMMGQKLTDPTKKVPGSVEVGQYATTADFAQSMFYPFLYSCGGDLALGEARLQGQLKSSPPLYTFNFDVDPYLDPNTQRQYKPGELDFSYKAGFNSAAGKRALEFMRKLRYGAWTRCPQCVAEKRNEPIDLTAAQVKNNAGDCPRHGRFALAKAGPNQTIRGIMLPAFSVDNTGNMFLRLQSGKVAMLSAYITEQMAIFSPKVIGFCPPPAPDAQHKSYLAGIPMFFGINADITDPQKQQAAWEYVAFKLGPKAQAVEARIWAQNGYAPFVLPGWLKTAGLDEYLRDVPQEWLDTYEYVDKHTRVIPYCDGWLPLEQELQTFLKESIASENFDWKARLDQVAATGNAKYFRGITEAQHQRYTWIVAVVCLFVLLIVVGAATILLREQHRRASEAAAKSAIAIKVTRARTLSAWLLLLPALLSIALWAYYPLVRGSFLAFQNYKMRGPVEWAGLNNFIEGLITGHFLHSLGVTVYFVVLWLGLGFLTPIFVALLLAEVPRGKYFFRTVFYLPAVTAGLVLTLLWMQFYMPTENGFLNSLLKPLIDWINVCWQGIIGNDQAVLVNFPIQWLLNKKTAMLSVILPSVWAGAGPGSILYLAALKTIPDDIYEAADLDGAGVLAKIRYVTLPYLTPLIMMNFIGSFIGSFQMMGNIFIMTGGGPDYATHVTALEIWTNAYANLRYGVATAQAWMLGSILIGFAVVQMRLLNKLNWRRADA